MTKTTCGAVAPETKSDTGEIADAFDDFMQSFKAFRSANDERLGELETRSAADVLTTEKVDRISAALDEHKKALDRLVAERSRPPLGGGTAAMPSSIARLPATVPQRRNSPSSATPGPYHTLEPLLDMANSVTDAHDIAVDRVGSTAPNRPWCAVVDSL